METVNFSLSTEQLKVQELARQFAQEEVAPLSREMDVRGEMSLDLLLRMGEIGLLGGPLPVVYSGGGWDSVSLALAYEELGRIDSSIRGFMTVHTSLVSQCILKWGSKEQKKIFLPKLAQGEWIGCYCLTEPNAGSDVASMESTADKDGDAYILNGEKIWITNGGIADVAIIFASHNREARHKGICAFLIDTTTPGFIPEKMADQELGHRASDHAVIRFKDCRVPESALLGQPGEGFKVAMSALDHGRLGVAAGALGVAQASLDASLEFVRKRRQFGKRIGDFEMIQASIADMACEVDAARMLVLRAAWLKDQGKSATRETSIAKLYATEAAVRIAGEAVLIHGGRGYSNEYPVERYYRDIKGLQIYEGTSHIQRIVIARDLIGKDKQKDS